MPTGTLIKKIQCQLRYSVINPPRMGPAAIPSETTGDIQADMSRGNITWNDLYAIQPASGTVLSMTLTGAQIRQALEQQWKDPVPPHNLIISGLAYTWDAAKPAGSKVTAVTIHGLPLYPNSSYTVSTVAYLALGGDGYTTFSQGTNMTYGQGDINALVSYIGSLPQPVTAPVDGRIQRIN